MLAPPSFATERLRYRAFEQDKDSDFVLQTLGEPVAQLGMMGRAVRPLTKSSDSIQFFYKLLSTAALGVVVCLPDKEHPEEAGEHVGVVLLDRLEEAPIHRCGHFGIALSTKHRGKGYATEAMEWLLRRAFVGFGLNRVESNVWSWNEAALNVYKRVGFQVEGVRREAVWQEGEFRDDYLIAILAKDWHALHPESRKSAD